MTKPLRNHDKAIKIYRKKGYIAYVEYVNRKKKGKRKNAAL